MGGSPPPVCQLSGCHNGVDSFLGDTVSGECNDRLAVGLLADPASCAADVIVNRSGANDNLTTGLCFIESAGFRGRYNSNRRNAVISHHCVGNFHTLSGNVDRESHEVSSLNRHKIVMLSNVVMSVSEALTTFVRHHKLAKHCVVNQAVIVRQIARSVVAPELTFGQLADLGAQFQPLQSTIHTAPVQRLRPIGSVAAFIEEGAARGTGSPLSAGRRDGSGFGVAASGIEGGDHGGCGAVDSHSIGGGEAVWRLPVCQLANRHTQSFSSFMRSIIAVANSPQSVHSAAARMSPRSSG